MKINLISLILFILVSCNGKSNDEQPEKINYSSSKDSIIFYNPDNTDNFRYCIYRDEKNDSLLFRLLFPPDYDSSLKYPMITFLHGAGERGKDNESQLNFAGDVFSEEETMKKYPAFVLVPQCPEEYRWVETDWSLEKHKMPESPSKPFTLLMPLIDKIISSYNIDTERLYIMGLSMGGFGVWDLTSRYPDKFAAAVPICGGGDEEQAKKLIKIPVWAFHGKLDKVVLPSRSVNMIDAIKNAGGNPKFTLYPDVAHGSWNNAFSEPDLFPWLFRHKLK
ncbi:MAG: dienelactone hydrolase family protein [Ignavibacteria bacterium]|nr:dienelactone hydrolase family protein [Ignavibacteria bacterium]